MVNTNDANDVESFDDKKVFQEVHKDKEKLVDGKSCPKRRKKRKRKKKLEPQMNVNSKEIIFKRRTKCRNILIKKSCVCALNLVKNSGGKRIAIYNEKII
jgi:hypothetical protein